VTGEVAKQWIYRHQLPATKQSNGYWVSKAKDMEDLHAQRDLSRKKFMVIGGTGTGLDETVSAIRELGHEPVIARNAADARLKARDLYPSLFVINVSAPHADAWEMLGQVRRTGGVHTSQSVVSVSGNPQSEPVLTKRVQVLTENVHRSGH
jgi:hypothetical protein